MKKEKEYMTFSQTCIPPLFLFGILACMLGTVMAGIFDQYILAIILFVLFFVCIGFTIWAFKKFRFRIDKNGITLWRGDFYSWEAFTDVNAEKNSRYDRHVILWTENATIKLWIPLPYAIGCFRDYCTNEKIYIKVCKDIGERP